MKGKESFTQTEANQIIELINQKVKADTNAQKRIRKKIRDLGFYASDFGLRGGYTSRDFLSHIKIIDDSLSKNLTPTKSNIINEEKAELNPKTSGLEHFLEKISNNKFIPGVSNERAIPNSPGNYIFCLKNGSSLPKIDLAPEFKNFEGLKVIYTGISSKSLRVRDYKQHFTGNNAGRSTLRKSLGSLMGLKKIPRDKDPSTGKTKFNEKDEEKLSKWMKDNLICYFLSNSKFTNYEIELINYFNPPLNLSKNNNPINASFRKELSRLRSIK